VKKNHLLKQDVQNIIAATREAGELIKAIRGKGYHIYDKGKELGLVTDADQAASTFLLQRLEKLFPNDLFISEEEPLPKQPYEPRRVWFIDPIDGTNEFIAGNQEWSIMIGLAVESKPCFGVVYQPDQCFTYYALKNEGAFLSTPQGVQTLRVNDFTDVTQAILLQSRSHWSARAAQIANELGIHKVFKQGSIGLKLGRIAEGKADLYFNFSGHCHLWDLCAPETILEEAGGIVLAATGNRIKYTSEQTLVTENFLASNKSLAKKTCHFLEE
jgi:3'(2'), 5'-bisphosphate nucleotidase